ncbi:hypothetical protein MRX96_010847 [Rhipicephalus microplus]
MYRHFREVATRALLPRCLRAHSVTAPLAELSLSVLPFPEVHSSRENPRLRSKHRPPVVPARALLCTVACVVRPGPQQHSVRIEDPPNGIARYQRLRYAGWLHCTALNPMIRCT